jgi:hypothetical protein
MPLGERALDPDTPYIVYEYSVGGKVFYVGIAAKESIRHTDRWNYVRNLVRHEDDGTLKPDKARDLYRKSNQVVAGLIRAGLQEEDMFIDDKAWEGLGRENAERAEAPLIRRRAEQGCLLANIQHNPNNHVTVDEILAYLGVRHPGGPGGTTEVGISPT